MAPLPCIVKIVKKMLSVVSMLIVWHVYVIAQLPSSPGSVRPQGTLDNAAAVSQEVEVKSQYWIQLYAKCRIVIISHQLI